MAIDLSELQRLVEEAHDAWSDADLDRLLEYFSADFEYQINAGTEDGSPVELKGREKFAEFWRPLARDMDTRTIPGPLLLRGDVARLQVQFWLRHHSTGFGLSGSYRQLLTFRGGLICRIEEYHEAAKLNSFWALVASETAKAGS